MMVAWVRTVTENGKNGMDSKCIEEELDCSEVEGKRYRAVLSDLWRTVLSFTERKMAGEKQAFEFSLGHVDF